MDNLEASLRTEVERWINEDPDQETKAELETLLKKGDVESLASRFSGMLKFGTAGLRGLLGGGPNRMNRAVVLRATAGLCEYLLETDPKAKDRGVIIGRDARNKSDQFADDVASVVLGYGIKALVFESVCPTPLLGFGSIALNAAAGVMITASHNPPDYNGYKVFWGNGAQIIPPHDAGIAEKIEAIQNLSDIPRGDLSHKTIISEEVRQAYLAGVLKAQRNPGVGRDLSIVYTAMHGVGGELLLESLSGAGFDQVQVVDAQQAPDGNFPTVEFPNPEEDGAMDMALAEAEKVGADLVLANDPDADRLAAIVRHDGAYRRLTGNDIGCLLAHYLLETSHGEGRLVLCSVVSSPMLLSIGEAHGVRAEQTLTGHKWIQNRALELKNEGFNYIFGYEEALGYGVGTLVRDKDGISAAVCLADMAGWCKSQGHTLVDELETMARRYGLYLSDQISVVLPGAEGRAKIDGRMAEFRAEPPTSLGGLTVTAVQDFETGTRRTMSGETSTLSFPPSNVVTFEIEGGHRAMARPSGTEPKLKHYLDVRVDLEEGESLDAARARGEAIIEALRRDFIAS